MMRFRIPILLLISLASLLPGQAPAGMFTAPPVAPPVMRIGLSTSDNRVVLLESAGGLRLVNRDTGESPWRDRYRGTTRVVLLGAGEVRTVYRVQVGSFAQEDVARELAQTLGADLQDQARVHHDSQRRLYRVRVGEFTGRTAAAAMAARLSGMGYEDAWVTTDSIGYADDADLRLVDQDYREKTIGNVPLVAFDATGGLVKVNERRYRGVVEVFVDDGGRLRVVNVVNLEEYLRGVVPDEMGPNVFPQVEALKAQAVAARTYAARNRGQYSDDGYDICDTPRCQVYGGADSEHELSDEAIAGTSGLVLAHGGELANTLFTSTCGGHTENVENVFPEDVEPYLRGVVCAPEREERGQVVTHVDGRSDLAYLSLTPSLAHGVARLAVLGVVDMSFILSTAMSEPLAASLWQEWLGRLAPLVGKNTLESADDMGKVQRGRMARDLVALMGWEERLQRLFDLADAAVLLGMAPDEPLPKKVRSSGGPHLALLTRDGLVVPPPVPGPPVWTEEISAREGLQVLARFALEYAQEPVKRRRIAVAAAGKLEMEDGESLPMAPGAFLFAATARGPVPVGRLAVTRHEPILIHRNGAGQVDYLEATRPYRSLDDDRFSSRYNWEHRASRSDLSKKLGRGMDFGELVDLEVMRRGVSGRAAELKVTGTRGEVTLRGFDIRVALGLRETLFTIDRQRGGNGRVQTFVFSGKGWGHGVGMCQVGAFGMAVRGRTFLEILTHYYTDVDVLSVADHPRFLSPPEAR